jgi:hypothetical protein
MSDQTRLASPEEARGIRAKPIVTLLLFAALAGGLRAQSSLFYLELQAVGGYSTASRSFELFSLTPEEAMQKPSIGFDFVKRIAGKKRDIGVLAVEARLAYSQEGAHKLEPQLYNAFFRLKAGFADIWIGHSRPALGISYTLDPHAILLPIPVMLGFGYDRDWGAGLQHDFSWGSVAASLTTGSGMPLYFRSNFLAAARVSYGVLARDNYSLGFSLAGGNVLETMGYTLLEEDPLAWRSASLDASFNWRDFESRAEVLYGRREGEDMALVFWRMGWNILEEGRLKAEVQPALLRKAGDWEYILGSGLTYLFNADLAGRLMILYDARQNTARFVVQLYYYKGL